MGENIVERARVAFVMAASAFERDVRLSELTDDETRGLLRAAIAALREPSEAMMQAGVSNNPTSWTEDTDKGFAYDVALIVWTSMIDASLSTEGNEG